MATTKARGSYDFETYDWTKAIACGVLWGPPGAREWDFIRDTKRPLEVVKDTLRLMALLADDGACAQWWAHNGGRFDTSIILEGVIALGWEVSGAVAGGRVVSMVVKPPEGTKFELRDSQAVVNVALRDAAVDFELAQRKTFKKADYSDPRAMLKLPAAALEAGCRADCEVVLQLLDKVETQLEAWGGELRLTFASSAFTVVKAHSPPLPDLRKVHGANEVARGPYMGGRVEVFRHAPAERLCELDVTSSYPWSMAGALPFHPIGCTSSPKALRDMLSDTGSTDGVVRARVTVPDCYLPALPWAHPDGGIYFPTGTWETWFQAEELRYAQSLGYVVQPKEGWQYTREAPFGDFVREVFSAKAKAVGALRVYLKYLLNAAYGKLGQHPDRENLLVFATEDEGVAYSEAHRNHCRVMSADGDMRFLARSVFRWPAHTHYALAGAITAKSRVLLHRALSHAVRPAYCDTDSVHAARGSLRTLRPMLGEHLGGLKVEVRDMRAKFYAPKLYELHTADGKHLYASKGFPVNAKTFREVVRGEVIHRERPRLMKRQLRHGGEAGVDDMARSWSGGSYKRRPLAGGETVPWTVDELSRDVHWGAVSPLGGMARERWDERQQ